MIHIGGNAHSRDLSVPSGVITYDVKGESYIRLQDGKGGPQIMMRCGMTPAEAFKQFRALTTERTSRKDSTG